MTKNFLLYLFKKFLKKKNTKNNIIEQPLNPIILRILKKIPLKQNIDAKNIMVPRTDVFSISCNISLQEMIHLLNTTNLHSRIPIYDKSVDDITGILYLKDLFSEIVLKKNSSFSIKDIMRNPYFIPESTKIFDLFQEFQNRHHHLAIVVDEYGGFSGIVSLEDILEEIVGEIQDEYDQDIQLIKKKTSDQYIINSKALIQDVNETLNIQLPKNNNDTIGGFIFEKFGYLPNEGDIITFKNIQFKILKIKNNRISIIQIYILYKRETMN